MTYTSKLVAVTNPQRWGFELVIDYFGVWRTQNRDVVVEGDILRRISDGTLFMFHERVNNDLIVTPVIGEHHAGE